MPTGMGVFLTALALAVMSLTAAAAAKRPGGQWNYFHFDGQSFVAGQSSDGTPSVAVRAGVRPVLVLVQQGVKLQAVPLGGGSGALVGICYQQRAGGKLMTGPAFVALVRQPVQVSSGDRVVASLETDAEGYFQVTLPAGRYQVRGRDPVEINVESGATTLIPLRVGKRMVD
jgi:hypothetical protein